MPNGTDVASQPASPAPSQESLDQLIAEAEQQAVTSVVNHTKPCEHTYSEATHKKCPTCLWSFCNTCASILDPHYCKLCLREADAEMTESPLKDDEGHTVQGRHMQPADTATFFQPRFGTLAKTISEMSDSELDDYVKQYIELVRQAEKALDFRRVVLGSSQLEVTQREAVKQRKLRADKTKYPVKTISIDPKTGKQTTKSVGTAALAQMLQALAALKALKDKQAAAKKADEVAKAVDAKMKEPRL